MRRLDLKDVKFNRLYVLDYSHRKGNHLYWKCICDCGKETYQCTTNLRQGKVVSCGCYAIELATNRLKLMPRVKFERGVASFNVLYSNYRRGAITRNIPFELDKDQFKSLVIQNCHYCNKEPHKSISRRGTNGSFTYNGVDRKDSDKSYNLDNCVACCSDCNTLKMDLPYSLFLNQIKIIYERFFK